MTRTVKIFLSILGIIVVALGIFFLRGNSLTDIFSAGKPESEERALMLTPFDLAPFFQDYYPNENDLTMIKVKYFGVTRIEADYTPSTHDQPSMSCSIHVSVSKLGAKQTYKSELQGIGVGLKFLGGATSLQEMSGITYGNESKFYLVMREEEPFGNVFAVAGDKRVYSCMIFGFYFEDYADLNNLVELKLSKFLSHDFDSLKIEEQIPKEREDG